MEKQVRYGNTVEVVRRNNPLLTQVWLKMRRRLRLEVCPQESFPPPRSQSDCEQMRLEDGEPTVEVHLSGCEGSE